MKNRFRPLFYALALTVAPSIPRAQAQTLEVQVQVRDPLDRQVRARLSGHLSDLPVTLQTARGEHVAASPSPRREGLAVEFKRSGDAPPRYEVWARMADGPRTLLGSLPLQDGALTSSALETAALLVRTGVQALLLGEPLPAESPPISPSVDRATNQAPADAPKVAPADGSAGPTPAAGRPLVADQARDQSAAARPENADPLQAQHVSEDEGPTGAREDDAASGGVVFARSLPAQSALDSDGRASNMSPPFQLQALLGISSRMETLNPIKYPSACLWLGLQHGAFEAGLWGTLALPATADDAFGPIFIAQHAVLGTFATRIWDGPVALWLGAESGLSLFYRSSRAESDQLTATPARLTPSWSLGPTLGLRFMPGRFGIRLRLALDILPSAPRFIYDGPDAPTDPAYKPATAALRIALGLQTRVL